MMERVCDTCGTYIWSCSECGKEYCGDDMREDMNACCIKEHFEDEEND